MRDSKGRFRSPVERRRFLNLSGMGIIAGASAVRTLGAAVAANRQAVRADEKIPAKSGIVIGQVKVVPEKGKLDANHKTLMDVLGELSKNQPPLDVVVTPEGFLDGYVSTEEKVRKEDMARYAIDPGKSPYIQAAAEWSRRNRSWLIYGCTRIEGGRVYNTALVINRVGSLVGMYDKLHLLRHDLKYEPGMNLNVYDSDFGPFGVTICADRRWPETIRTMALKGARVIFLPTYGSHNDMNLCLMRTRSFENELFTVFTHPQQSLVTNPQGQAATNDENPEHRFAISQIDLKAADERRASDPGFLRHRRPDVYKL